MSKREKMLLLATRNPGKARELAALLEGCPLELTTLADQGIAQEVQESGDTLEENALLKARTYAGLGGLPTLADDSGLEVEALGGEPGVLSSRYAGPEATDEERVVFLLEKLDNIPWERRDARFRCIVALVWPSGKEELFEGECRGRIISQPRGNSGFGYDPIFYLPELGKTMAELSLEEKNRLSHRSRAAQKALETLKREVMEQV